MKQPFIPQKMKDIKLDFVKLIPLISKSNQVLSNYNGVLQHLVNPDILLAPMTMQESTLSSKIEGTQASLTEVFKYEAGENYNDAKVQDINEIRNYRKAMTKAVDILEERPFIHLNMVKEIHKVLLDGVRGSNKNCGEFRKIQNWIGKIGTPMENAVYIPPSPNEIQSSLTDWEKFINDNYNDILIQLALIHAQFEIIHPFVDGNGRLGRILIPIFLYIKEYLFSPMFYLSEYFEANRDEYYLRLNNITANNDWQGWVEFFLNAIIKQSSQNINKTKQIMNLYEDMKQKIQQATKSQYTSVILDTLFIKPVINSSSFAKALKINRKATANAILQKLVNANIIKIIKAGKGNRAAIYVFTDLINITEGKEVV